MDLSCKLFISGNLQERTGLPLATTMKKLCDICVFILDPGTKLIMRATVLRWIVFSVVVLFYTKQQQDASIWTTWSRNGFLTPTLQVTFPYLTNSPPPQFCFEKVAILFIGQLKSTLGSNSRNTTHTMKPLLFLHSTFWFAGSGEYPWVLEFV